MESRAILELAKKMPKVTNRHEEDKEILVDATNVLRNLGYNWTDICKFFAENEATLGFATIRKAHRLKYELKNNEK